MVRREQAIPCMLFIVLLLVKISRLPLRFLLAHIRYPGIFVLAGILILPLQGGDTVWFALGPLTLWKEGTSAALLIVARFFSILTTGIVLFGTAPFLTTMFAMRALGIPSLLIDMLVCFYRYLQDIAERLQAMQIAVRLRGFGGNTFDSRTLKTLAALVGTLLIRSAEQSEQVWRAMHLRGYGQRRYAPIRSRAHWTDWSGLLGTVAATIVIVLIGTW